MNRKAALLMSTVFGMAVLAQSPEMVFAQSLPSKPRVLAYPGGAGGIPTPLGIGWNSDTVSATPSICIVFQEATSQDSDAVYSTRTVVSDKFTHSQAINVSADVQVKGIAGVSVDAKTTYSNSTEISGSELTVVDHMTVDRGVRYAAPATVGNVAQFTSQVQTQSAANRDPSQIQRALNIDTSAVHQRFAGALATPTVTHARTQRERAMSFATALQHISTQGGTAAIRTNNATAASRPSELSQPLPAGIARLAGVTTGGSIPSDSFAATVRLTDDMAQLATSNPIEFRRRCGDGYVASISQGGELAITYRIAASSVQRQQEIASSLGVSYSGGVVSGSANVSVSTTLKNMNESGHTSITMYRSGGSGQPVATTLDQIDALVSGFPAAVQSAPRNYLITVIDYRTLPNYSSTAAGMKEITGYELLAWEYGKAAAVHAAATDILADYQSAQSGQPAKYLFGRSGTLDGVRQAQAAATARLTAIRAVAQSCMTGGSCAVSGTFDDYALRAAFPLPILSANVGSVAQALWSADSAYRAAVVSQWIDGPNAIRCLARPGDPAFCADDSALQTSRSRVPVTTAWFMLELTGNPGTCLRVPPRPNGWATSGPCPGGTGDPTYLFRYDQDSGVLRPQSWQSDTAAAFMPARWLEWPGTYPNGIGRIGTFHTYDVLDRLELGLAWDFRANADNTGLYMVVRTDAPNQRYSTLVGACFMGVDPTGAWVTPCRGASTPTVRPRPVAGP